MTSGLILVDFQNDYFPSGSMELVGIEDAAFNAHMILSHYRKTHLPVFHVQHLSLRPGSTFFLPGTAGVDIHSMVAPCDKETVVQKHYPNSFRGTQLQDILEKEEMSELIICGAMSHMCIDATTRAAFDLGFNCIVAEDACATRDLVFQGRTIAAADVHASFMAALSALYANVISSKDIVASLA
jgi:nicotinamidase-related amidase